VYQLNTTKANLLVVHSSVFKVASEAAKVSGIPADRIVLIDAAQPSGVADRSLLTVEQLVNEGAKHPQRFSEKKLRSGEGKTKVAVSRVLAALLIVADLLPSS
jgi:4-coumarate--CoA ligase